MVVPVNLDTGGSFSGRRLASEITDACVIAVDDDEDDGDEEETEKVGRGFDALEDDDGESTYTENFGVPGCVDVELPLLLLPKPVLPLLEAFGYIRLYTLAGTETDDRLSILCPKIVRCPVCSNARVCSRAVLTGAADLLPSNRDRNCRNDRSRRAKGCASRVMPAENTFSASESLFVVIE